MNLDAVKLRIDLIDYLTILALKYTLLAVSQRTHHSADEKTSEEISGEAATVWHPGASEIIILCSINMSQPWETTE
jgi:hypothetical protein